jgi:hypothetical protein
MIFECQVLHVVFHCCCMVASSVLLLDELNIDSLFNTQIDYMCFIYFLFVVKKYIKYKPIYIYNIS